MVPRKIVQMVNPETDQQQTTKSVESSSRTSSSTTTSGSTMTSGFSKSPSSLVRSGSTGSVSCQSVLSFDRLIPRSGEAANRKRTGKNNENFWLKSHQNIRSKLRFKLKLFCVETFYQNKNLIGYFKCWCSNYSNYFLFIICLNQIKQDRFQTCFHNAAKWY